MPSSPTPAARIVLPELRGREGALDLRLDGLPCRIDPLGGRRYPWPDFGNELLEALWNALGDPALLHTRLASGAPLRVEFHLRDGSPLALELSGRPPAPRHLASDLADALLAALHAGQVEP